MANTKKTEEATAPVAPALNKQETVFLKYRKAIIGVVAAVIIGIAVYIGNKQFYGKPREDKAATALAKAQDMFGQEKYAEALNGVQGTEGFLAITENYSGTDAANLAKLYAGICYAKQEKWQEAVNYISDYSDKGDALISPAALGALGDAYANLGDLDKAIASFKEAAEKADKKAEGGINISVSPVMLMKAGRLLEEQKKNDEALEIYQQVKTKYVNSPLSMEVDKYIERLKK